MRSCAALRGALLALLLPAWAVAGNSSGSKQKFRKDKNLVQLSGGKFQMGTSLFDSKSEDGPPREVTVKPFLMDKYPVSNRDFREFVQDRKYKTEAEEFGWSFVFEDFVPEDLKKKVTQKLQSAPWWLPIENAFWRQGNFPDTDTAEDGYHGVSPVAAFPPQNSYGIYDLLGNTWEWTASAYRPPGRISRQPAQEMRVLRGASWIDTVDGSANHKARVTTRMGNTPDSASDNLSFRCAASLSLESRNKNTEL